jgi:chromosome segregation ATPase
VVKEQISESTNTIGWAQDQIYQMKAAVAALEQRFGHLQSVVTQLTETMRGAEASLREALAGAGQTPRLQEELNQTVALVVQLQDQHAEARERLDALGRREQADHSRDEEEWTELARRTDQLERQVALWHDRQAGVDEVGRRFQERVSLINQRVEEIDRRLESTEGKAARALEGSNRAEHSLTQTDAGVLAIRSENEAIAERLRVTAEVAHRLENTVTEQLQNIQRMELLAERIELHRAERQRLEDRALRLEEELRDLRQRSEAEEHHRGQLVTHQSAIVSRLDALQEQMTEQRNQIVEQIRKLTSSQERTKRRQVQELERELREMRQYIAALTDQSTLP